MTAHPTHRFSEGKPLAFQHQERESTRRQDAGEAEKWVRKYQDLVAASDLRLNDLVLPVLGQSKRYLYSAGWDL